MVPERRTLLYPGGGPVSCYIMLYSLFGLELGFD